MDFTSVEWTTLITALSAFVVVVGGVAVNIIMSLKKTVDATAGTVKETADKLSEVAVKVDGAASASAAEIKSLQEMMVVLRGQIADQKQTAAVLAQGPPLVTSKELNGPVIATLKGIDNTIEGNLRSIDENTAETARNTARTEETVKKLEKEEGT